MDVIYFVVLFQWQIRWWHVFLLRDRFLLFSVCEVNREKKTKKISNSIDLSVKQVNSSFSNLIKILNIKTIVY